MLSKIQPLLKAVEQRQDFLEWFYYKTGNFLIHFQLVAIA